MERDILERVVAGETRLTLDQARALIDDFTDLHRRKANVVDIPDKRLVIVGDLHGELDQALEVVRRYVGKYHVVFLGDYGDRGPQQVETFNLVMALAVLYPRKVTVLRGNHEAEEVAMRYGMYESVARAYSRDAFLHYCEAFSVLPVAAMNRSGLFCCHGGVPEGLTSIDQLQSVDRLTYNPEDPLLFQLLWNDPREGDFYFTANLRGGGSRYFGRLAFEEFRKASGTEMMIRAHEVYTNGYIALFDGRLISVFSATYMGRVAPKVIVYNGPNEARPAPL